MLYIKIKDGQPFEHPIVEDNLIAAFPEVDINNLPASFAPFEKTEIPSVGVYETYKGSVYQWEGNIVKEVHLVETMSEEEKTAKQNEVKELWYFRPGWNSWIFNEELCIFEPPIPYPNDGKMYIWEEALQEWKLPL